MLVRFASGPDTSRTHFWFLFVPTAPLWDTNVSGCRVSEEHLQRCMTTVTAEIKLGIRPLLSGLAATLRRSILHSGLKIEAVCSRGTLASTCKSTPQQTNIDTFTAVITYDITQHGPYSGGPCFDSSGSQQAVSRQVNAKRHRDRPAKVIFLPTGRHVTLTWNSTFT
jgi:hypothetical protein